MPHNATPVRFRTPPSEGMAAAHSSERSAIPCDRGSYDLGASSYTISRSNPTPSSAIASTLSAFDGASIRRSSGPKSACTR